jgi:hypothetical protein
LTDVGTAGNRWTPISMSPQMRRIEYVFAEAIVDVRISARMAKALR